MVVEVKRRRWWWFGCGCLGMMLVVAIWLLWASLGMEVKRCLRGGVGGGKEVKVVVFELWLFGNDVGGSDLVVGG